jgi:hypothetical protein
LLSEFLKNLENLEAGLPYGNGKSAFFVFSAGSPDTCLPAEAFEAKARHLTPDTRHLKPVFKLSNSVKMCKMV